MFNFFEQPWSLLGAAVIVLFGVLTFRSVWPEKFKPRHWLLPLSVAALGFALDYLVKTDREKLNALIDTVVKAVEEENCPAIDAAVADDYRDSFHAAKPDLMAHCRRTLPGLLIAKNTKRACLLQISPPTAKATIFTTTTFEQNSWVSQSYKSFLFFKGELLFRKQPDNSWLITRINPLEVDKQPINWREINYSN